MRYRELIFNEVVRAWCFFHLVNWFLILYTKSSKTHGFSGPGLDWILFCGFFVAPWLGLIPGGIFAWKEWKRVKQLEALARSCGFEFQAEAGRVDWFPKNPNGEWGYARDQMTGVLDGWNFQLMDVDTRFLGGFEIPGRKQTVVRFAFPPEEKPDFNQQNLSLDPVSTRNTVPPFRIIPRTGWIRLLELFGLQGGAFTPAGENDPRILETLEKFHRGFLVVPLAQWKNTRLWGRIFFGGTCRFLSESEDQKIRNLIPWEWMEALLCYPSIEVQVTSTDMIFSEKGRIPKVEARIRLLKRDLYMAKVWADSLQKPDPHLVTGLPFFRGIELADRQSWNRLGSCAGLFSGGLLGLAVLAFVVPHQPLDRFYLEATFRVAGLMVIGAFCGAVLAVLLIWLTHRFAGSRESGLARIQGPKAFKTG